MPVYSSLTFLIFCTDALIKYFIPKTDHDWCLETALLSLLPAVPVQSSTSAVTTARSFWALGMAAVEQGQQHGGLGLLAWMLSTSKHQCVRCGFGRGSPSTELLPTGSLML